MDGEGSRISIDEYFALHNAIDEEAGDSTLAPKAGKVFSIELIRWVHDTNRLLVAVCHGPAAMMATTNTNGPHP